MQREWLACQIEYATPVCQNADEGLEHLRSFRRELAEAAGDNDLIAVGLGAAPAIPVESAMVTDTERYQQIGEHLPGIAAEQYVSGLHIHVSIPDQEAGVVALNAMRPWLPLLVALGANSPYWRAMDAGFASWRTIQYRRWSVQGIPPRFKDALDYRQRLERLMNSDVLLDGGHIGWAARLSANYPTIEARVADSQLRAEDSVLLALVVRALVDTAVENPGMAEDYPPEVLDLAF